ncbi:hypothetical protein HXX76_007215 [Chlamydomonas incerta]|uniref:Uncharacterized protein n=1 Tax=Chlamydomonas incerta TaxID=51695 RepID=A0A835W0V9_CHLIN|nr:hypothetical protein HXX76_007215 [Chlamydomonas incerta]|eukprot:KAG2435130.1 hypothetical protein HXX76_007215 [Chlamydomonas incerta]
MKLQSKVKCRGGQLEPCGLRRAFLCSGRRTLGRSSPIPSPSQPELTAPASRVTVRSSLAEAADAASRHATAGTRTQAPLATPAGPPETVTRHNFAAALPVIRTAIRDATFVAIDAEFTGLSPEGSGGGEELDDYEERYRRIASAASSFVIGQFGISAFKWVPAPAAGGGRGGGGGGGGGSGHWEARTFNVYVFPRPHDGLGLDRRFMCQASSLTYLAEQGFDFNKMIRDGVSYLPLSYRDAKAAALAEQADNQARSSELKGADEQAFAEETRRVVREWLLGGEAELQVKLPPTRRLRTLQRLLVQHEFQLPSAGWGPFSIEELYPLGPASSSSAAAAAAAGQEDGEEAGAPGGGGSSSEEDGVGSGERRGQAAAADGGGGGGVGGGVQLPPLDGLMVLRRLDSWRPEELAAAGLQITAKQRLELLAEQTGFSLVIDALREARRPVVGHNAALDLVYLLAQFVESPPPRSWAAAKAALARALPGGLYDTKHVAAAMAAQYGLAYGGDTGLGSLYGHLMDEAWLRRHVPGVGGLPYLGLGGGGGGGGGAGGLGEGVPGVRHAPGFVAYADVADASKAHEAGFDAFMTGCVFARLLRIAEAKAAGAAAATGGAASSSSGGVSSNGSSEGGAGASDEDEAAASEGSASGAQANVAGAPDAAASTSTSGSSGSSSSHDGAAALLQPLAPYRGRVYIMRSDLPYYDLYGADPVASRPAVVHVTGFTPATRYSYLQQRFEAAGLGQVQVCMLPAASGSGSGGAFVQLSRPELVSRALATARKRWPGWTVMTYAEYAASRRQQSGGGGGGGLGPKADGGRASPRLIGAQRAAAVGTAAAAAAGAAAGGVEAAGAVAAAAGGAEAAGASEGAGAGAVAAGAVRAGAGGGLESERRRLKAFTRRVAAVSGGLPPPAPATAVEAEGGAEEPGAGEAGAAAAAAQEAAAAATVDAVDAAQAAAKQAAEAEAEAARQAAEKLYSLARAAEKLRGGFGASAAQDGAAGSGSGSSSGAALGLQRPGRPGRKL